LADHGERIKHRPVFLVVRAECQGVEDDRQHAGIVRAVEAADHRVQMMPVQRARGLALGDEIAQGLLIDDRKDNLAHRIVRSGQACRSEFEQQRRLAGDTLEVGDQLAFDPLLGLGGNAELADSCAAIWPDFPPPLTDMVGTHRRHRAAGADAALLGPCQPVPARSGST
jgi:hypothetical protein